MGMSVSGATSTAESSCGNCFQGLGICASFSKKNTNGINSIRMCTLRGCASPCTIRRRDEFIYKQERHAPDPHIHWGFVDKGHQPVLLLFR